MVNEYIERLERLLNEAANKRDRLAAENERLRKMALNCGADRQEQAMEIERLRAELDVLDKSHADLARRLADSGRENGRLRSECSELSKMVAEARAASGLMAKDAEIEELKAALALAI